jgi:hypothetical protein
VSLFMAFNAGAFWVGLLATELYSMVADEWQVITTKNSAFSETVFVDNVINVLEIYKWYIL